MTNFAENFSNTSDQALLHVMEFSDQYVSEALEAAIDELKRRNLSPQQIDAARKAARQFEEEKQAKAAKKQQKANASNKQMNLVLDKIVFWKEEPKDLQFKYKLLLFLTSLLAVYGLYWTGETFYYLITDGISSESFFYMFPSVMNTLLFAFGVILAFMRNHGGWVILLGLCFYRLIAIAVGLLGTVGILSEMAGDNELFTSIIKGAIENVAFLLVYAVVIYLLLQSSIRAHFKIKAGSFMAALMVAVFITLIFFGWFFLIPG